MRSSTEHAAQSANGAGPAPSPVAPSPEALRAEIAQTRAALAETTEALVDRFDVPTRVRERLARSRVLHDRPTLVAAALVAVWALRRSRG